MESIVSIRTCKDYSPQALSAALEKALGDLKGMNAWIKPGDRVLLKPNLLLSAKPEDAVVTHPAFVEAVASLVLDAGASVFLGDSPPLGNLKRVLAKSGYEPFMKRLGVQAVPFSEKMGQEFPSDRFYRRIDLAKQVFEFDAVINLPKLKTHGQMMLTLAVKNLFGTVIGSDKAAWHLAGREVENFATALVQIYEKVRPKVSILDGILAMEGNGPSSGTPRHLGIIAAAEDAVALDATICTLVGYPLEKLHTCVIAEKMGVGIADPDRIRVVGDSIVGMPLTDFARPKSLTVAWNLSKNNLLRRFAEHHLVTRPAIDPAVCQLCGICIKHCPPQAIREVHGTLQIDRQKCILCFCCHELCTNKAIRMVKPFLGRMLASFTR
jgi:uncharacterized protein (DUF362 family)